MKYTTYIDSPIDPNPKIAIGAQRQTADGEMQWVGGGAVALDKSKDLNDQVEAAKAKFRPHILRQFRALKN